jgi:hypothetical protein
MSVTRQRKAIVGFIFVNVYGLLSQCVSDPNVANLKVQNLSVLYRAIICVNCEPMERREIFLTFPVLVEIEGHFTNESNSSIKYRSSYEEKSEVRRAKNIQVPT